MDLSAIATWVIQTPSLFHATYPVVGQAPFSMNRFAKKMVPEISGRPTNPRLGFLYQHICSMLFDASLDYSKKAEEIQLIDAGKTIGAIDFILENQMTSGVEHWEVAIKFYLLHNGHWFGPNAKDRLDKKLNHMCTHQLPLSQHLLFLQRYPEWQDLSHHLLMQGRLYINPFTPEDIPTHCLGFPLNASQIQGYWCYQSQRHQIREPLYLLSKHQWMTGQIDPKNRYQIDSEHSVHCQSDSGIFWFIVPDTWPSLNFT